MMRYFFHSIDGQTICDEEGIELRGDAEAIARAHHEVRILASEKILTEGALLLHEQIAIVDADGRHVQTLAVRDAIIIEE